LDSSCFFDANRFNDAAAQCAASRRYHPYSQTETQGQTAEAASRWAKTRPKGHIEEAEAKEKIPKRTLPHASRDCILLAGAYLFGTFLAGALSALYSAGELETLGYYLDCWRASFAANTAAEVVGLFRTEFLTTSGALVGVSPNLRRSAPETDLAPHKDPRPRR